jgi:hypothetical protein
LHNCGCRAYGRGHGPCSGKATERESARLRARDCASKVNMRGACAKIRKGWKFWRILTNRTIRPTS